MDALTREGKTDTEAFERCLAEVPFGNYLALPPLFGLFHGVWLGALGGALCGLNTDWGFSAFAAAALGMVVGPISIAFVAGMTLAWTVEVDKGLPLRVRLARRGLLVVSPLFIVPAAWYCVRRVVRRRGGA
ncbi:MAG: hypothetical protein HYS12_18210 [Planctomycetes bacterium]|nr:hypothetical protein [Planctomycetota bacterium]